MSAAVALTASGQSIIVPGVAASSGAFAEVVMEFECAVVFATEWARCLGQLSSECIEAQAPPAATIIEELVDDATSFDAAAVIRFSQPSMQPAPAIHKPTASASDTRTTLIEETNLIGMSV